MMGHRYSNSLARYFGQLVIPVAAIAFLARKLILLKIRLLTKTLSNA